MPSKSSVLVFHADPDPKIGFGSDINKKVASDNGLCGPTINDSGSEESAQVQEVAEQAAAESGAAAGPESAEPGAAEQAATAEAARVKEAEAEAERAAQQPTAGRAGLLQQLQDSTNRLKLRKSTAPKNRRPVQDQDPVDNQAIRRAELLKAIKANANAGDKSAVQDQDPVDNQAIRQAELLKAIKANANAGDKSAVKSVPKPISELGDV